MRRPGKQFPHVSAFGVSVIIGALAAMTMLGPLPSHAQVAQQAPESEPPLEPLARKRATLVADNMTGDQVVPGPGDPDGFGTARLPNDAATGRICWNIDTERIDLPLTGTLIHAGGAGQVGVVVLQLFGEVDTPDPSGCRTVTNTQLLRDLNQKSQEFYLEIGNAVYPEGAIRGQLHLERFDA